MSEKKQQPYLAFIIIFILGFVSGVGFSAYKLNPGSGGTAGVASQQEGGQSAQVSESIANLEAAVTANPEDFNSWIQLGHLYYDTDQYQKAITAYTTSLKYHAGDANLLTDLGVMYRRSDQPQKAIEYFKKAEALDPQHQASRFNEGIVRFYDLGDTAGAIASWEELLKINPEASTGNGQKVRDLLEQMKSGQLKK